MVKYYTQENTATFIVCGNLVHSLSIRDRQFSDKENDFKELEKLADEILEKHKSLNLV